MQKGVDELTDEIKKGEIAIFCGAGISLNSGIPIVPQLLRDLLTKLNLPEDHIQLLLQSGLPFEAFMEVFDQVSDITALLDIFTIKNINPSHRFIAALQEKFHNKYIITTNFDTMIEDAFIDRSLCNKKARIEEFTRINWDQDQCIKIHGCIEDKYSIEIVLQLVASAMLAQNKKEVIDTIFSKGPHKSVLIIGYSCSDIFDVTQLLESIDDSDKYIYFIQHANQQEILCEPIEILDYKNPFKKFKGTRIYANTDLLLSSIAASLSLPIGDYKDCTPDISWTKRTLAWIDQFEPERLVNSQYRIASKLFTEITKYEIALDYLGKLTYGNEPDDDGNKYMDMANCGFDLMQLGRYDEALQLLEKASDYFSRFPEHENLYESTLNNLGGIYYYTDRPKQAFECYFKCLKLADRKNKMFSHVRILANIANIISMEHNNKRALNIYREALIISQQAGYKRLEASILSQLERIMFNDLNYAKADETAHSVNFIYANTGAERLEYRHLIGQAETLSRLRKFKEAASLLRKIDIDYTLQAGERAFVYSKLINVLSSDGDLLAAAGVVKKAEILIEQNDIPDEMRCWVYDSFAFYLDCSQAKYDANIIQYLELAMRYSRGNKTQEAYILYNFAKYYNKYKLWDLAKKYLFETEKVVDDLKEKFLQQQIYTEIGHYYNGLGNDFEALDYFKKALAIAENSGNEAATGKLYDFLAMTHYNRGDMRQAFQSWARALKIAEDTNNAAIKEDITFKMNSILPYFK